MTIGSTFNKINKMLSSSIYRFSIRNFAAHNFAAHNFAAHNFATHNLAAHNFATHNLPVHNFINGNCYAHNLSIHGHRIFGSQIRTITSSNALLSSSHSLSSPSSSSSSKENWNTKYNTQSYSKFFTSPGYGASVMLCIIGGGIIGSVTGIVGGAVKALLMIKEYEDEPEDYISDRKKLTGTKKFMADTTMVAITSIIGMVPTGICGMIAGLYMGLFGGYYLIKPVIYISLVMIPISIAVGITTVLIGKLL